MLVLARYVVDVGYISIGTHLAIRTGIQASQEDLDLPGVIRHIDQSLAIIFNRCRTISETLEDLESRLRSSQAGAADDEEALEAEGRNEASDSGLALSHGHSQRC